ncbi:MAG: hypothetical protein ACLR23_29245 [Clostridia bacterium]
MADKKAQRLFLRLISETFFVSDDTLDSKKIDRLVKRLDRLDPILFLRLLRGGVAPALVPYPGNRAAVG